MVKIKKRLESLTKFIEKDDKLIDVGCDHALLDIYLVQNEYIDKMYVCDVNPNALENGKKNIEANNLTNKITPILGFGIEKTGNLDIDTVLISGMGTNSIIEILTSPFVDKIYKLILQSNNNHYELRKFLTKIGFTIFYEEIIKDGKKYYINILALRDMVTKKYSEKEYLFGPTLINDTKNLNYFINLKETYEELYIVNRSEENEIRLKYLREIVSDLSKKLQTKEK